MPEDIPKLPYTADNTNDILGYFGNYTTTAYLRITTHAFMKFFNHSIQCQLLTPLTKLKIFLDFVLNNVLPLTQRPDWDKKQMGQFDLARNLWVI